MTSPLDPVPTTHCREAVDLDTLTAAPAGPGRETAGVATSCHPVARIERFKLQRKRPDARLVEISRLEATGPRDAAP